MNPYRNLDTAYRHLALRSTPPAWQSELGDLDGIVTAIRHDHPDPTASDTMLRRLLAVGRAEPDALTVALYALAPALRARIGRAVTDEYRADALTDLAFVLLDSALDRPRLAHRPTTAPTRPLPESPGAASSDPSPSPPTTPSNSPTSTAAPPTSPTPSPPTSTSPASTPPCTRPSPPASCPPPPGLPTETTGCAAPSTPPPPSATASSASSPPEPAPASNPSSTPTCTPHDPPQGRLHRDMEPGAGPAGLSRF
jgi:hypothetical protein